MRVTGHVKWFNATKGFGFLHPDGGGTDVFVHSTALREAGIPALFEGERISFDTTPDAKGKGVKAINLKLEKH